MAHKAIKENNLEGIIIEEIPHPSPANPLANKDKGALWKKISKVSLWVNKLVMKHRLTFI